MLYTVHQMSTAGIRVQQQCQHTLVLLQYLYLLTGYISISNSVNGFIPGTLRCLQ